MHRWGALLFFVMMAGFVALVVTSRPPEGSSPPRFDGVPTTLPPIGAPEAPLLDSPAQSATAQPLASSDGATLPDGEPASLAGDRPSQVTFGVLLIGYRGAEAAKTERSREEAQVLAKQLAVLAEKDFKGAVEKADAGFENAGVIQRGVLEPAPEQVLFELAPGAIGGPVDSPRGFYVFRRID